MDRIFITDVAPRDGLQNQKKLVETGYKKQLIELLLDAGLTSIETTSFVSPKAVPQMADAHEVMSGLTVKDDIRLSALVPNVKGLERAIAAGTREIAVVLSATETMNQKNINRSLDDAIQDCEQTLNLAASKGLATRAYIAVAFECPYEGLVSSNVVVRLAKQMFEAKANEIVIADTIGAASPKQVTDLLNEIKKVIPLDQIGTHFHDTRGMAVANVWASLQVGVRRFDSSVGGIGGCPFAPGASGNVATEDIVQMAKQCGFETGISMSGLLKAVTFSEKILSQQNNSKSISWFKSHHER